MEKNEKDVHAMLFEKKKKKKKKEKKKPSKGIKKAEDSTQIIGSVTKAVSGVKNALSLGSKLKFIAMRGGGCMFLVDILILLLFQALNFAVYYYTEEYTSNKARDKDPWMFMLIFAGISLCSHLAMFLRSLLLNFVEYLFS